MASSNEWHEFDENDLETYPRDREPIEAEYANGARVQGSYSSRTRYLSLENASTSDVGGANAVVKRWRYLNLP